MKLPADIPNPFRMGVMPDPWKPVDVDVPDIHRDVFDVCCDAVRHVRQNQQSAGVLIHGQAGSGKTHLLSRLRSRFADRSRYADLDQPRQIFVFVRLATNPRRIWRHTRERFVDDLLRPMPDGLTQLEHLLVTRMAELAEGGGDLARWWEFMRDERPDTLDELLDHLARSAQAGDELLHVLEQLMCGRNRRQARSWLRGDALSEAGMQRLGVATQVQDDEAPEQHAKNVVLQLCRLAGPRIPIVFCFDQIEALELDPHDRSFLQSFGKLLADLHDETAKTVLISCVQSTFIDAGRVREETGEAQALASYAYARMTSFADRTLETLDFDDATKLVIARLNSSPELVSLGRHQSSEFWPLDREDVVAALEARQNTPRELLAWCARRFAQVQQAADVPPAPAMPVAEFLRQTWEQRVEQALAENDPEETESLLADVPRLLIPLITTQWNIEEGDALADLRDIDFVLRQANGEGSVGVSFCTQPNMNSLGARLKRLLQSRPWPFGKLVLIRDSRTPISGGALRVQEYMTQLQADDAYVSRPGVETMAALQALRTLLSDAQSGDLACEGETVEVQSVREWLARHLSEPLRELVDQLVDYPGVGARDDSAEAAERRRDQLMDDVGEPRRLQSVYLTADEHAAVSRPEAPKSN